MTSSIPPGAPTPGPPSAADGGTSGPKLSLLPRAEESLDAAVRAGGGTVQPLSEATTGLILSSQMDAAELIALLELHSGIGWVQLPSAGVERYRQAFSSHPQLQWTSAKGAFARPVAEHALALTLALLRRLPERIRATAWGEARGTSLFGMRVVIVGAGGIALEIIRLLEVFETHITVLRRGTSPVQGADHTLSLQFPGRPAGTDCMRAGAGLGPAPAQALAEADVVVLAAALTDETKGLIGAGELAYMKPSCILINIARGGLVVTDALVDTLATGALAGAGLDVTDPEPLPEGHALWREPNAIITPHTADTAEMVRPLMAERVRENVRRWGANEPLLGQVNTDTGY